MMIHTPKSSATVSSRVCITQLDVALNGKYVAFL